MLLPRKSFKDADDAKAFLAENADIATANFGMMINCVIGQMEDNIDSVLTRMTVLDKMLELEQDARILGACERDSFEDALKDLERQSDEARADLARYRSVFDIACAVKEIQKRDKLGRVVDAFASRHGL